jgi:hypothetical protein
MLKRPVSQEFLGVLKTFTSPQAETDARQMATNRKAISRNNKLRITPQIIACYRRLRKLHDPANPTSASSSTGN